MADLRTEHEVNAALRRVFANATAKSDPSVIVADSLLHDPPPPPGDLGLPPSPSTVLPTLIALGMRELLGAKIAHQFASFLIPPEFAAFMQFGQLAASVFARVNTLARRAVTLAIAEAMPRKEVFPMTPIEHPNEPGAFDFANRLQEALNERICTRPFAFAPNDLDKVTSKTTVGKLTDDVVAMLAKSESV